MPELDGEFLELVPKSCFDEAQEEVGELSFSRSFFEIVCKRQRKRFPSRKCIFVAENASLQLNTRIFPASPEECRRRQVIDLRILLAAAEEERDAYLTKLNAPAWGKAAASRAPLAHLVRQSFAVGVAGGSHGL